MTRFPNAAFRSLMIVGMILGSMAATQSLARADDEGRTNLHILVTDRESGKPIYQARLTLIFHEEVSTVGIKHAKPISFSAKTDLKGKYRFTDIPRGKVRLLVTAERHKSFGDDFIIDKDNQEIHVEMKRPQPLI